MSRYFDKNELSSDNKLSSDNGLLLSNSSISTSDLYKMQKRIYSSDSNTEPNTESDTEFKFDTESDTESDQESTSHTEKVNRATQRMERHKNIFSSESKEILGMNSDSFKYMKKKNIKKNQKYN